MRAPFLLLLNTYYISHHPSHHVIKLYVIIDEYDVSINTALGNRALVSALQVDEERLGNLKRMENTYADFFSRLKTACDDNVAQCFMTGVTPLALNGFNIAVHITHDLEFASLYGFTEADVRNGLARLKPQLGGDPEVVERIVESWRRDHNGYYFNPRQKVALFNPTRVLHVLGELERGLRLDPPPSTLRGKEVANYLLNRIRSDSNSMPAEMTLEAIKSNPNVPVVMAEALSSDRAELECVGGVANQFRLSHMHELTTDRKPLLSFMFYNGALTYAPSSPNSIELKHSLRIPNNVAREEFAVELSKMLGLGQIGLADLRAAIAAMVDKRQVEPFCQALSQHLLSGLGGRDALGGEDPFAQGLLLQTYWPVVCRRNEMMIHMTNPGYVLVEGQYQLSTMRCHLPDVLATA